MDATTLMSTREVARCLGVSVPTVTRLARDERLAPAQKLEGLRGAYLFDRDDVEALARSLGKPWDEDPQTETEVACGTPDVAADADETTGALDDAAQLAVVARPERIAAVAGPYDAGLDAEDDLEARRATAGARQCDADGLGDLLVSPGGLSSRDDDALVARGVEERRSGFVGLGGTREETHADIVAAARRDVQTTDAGTLTRAGAPAGGRAGSAEPAPASTRRRIARPRVRVERMLECLDPHEASCEHCDWTYRSGSITDVREKAAWHRRDHRYGIVEVTR